MKVLLTTDAVGGVWQYTAELAQALATRGVTCVVAVLGPAPSADQRAGLLEGARDAITLIETGLPLDWTCDAAAPVLAAGRAIAALAVEQGVDLIQYNMPTLAAAGPLPVPAIAVAHGCVATWWEAAKGTPLDQAYRWHRKLSADGLRAVDRVVAPTAAYAGIVGRHYRLKRPALAVHNGRTLVAAGARAGAGADELPDIALTVGRLWDGVKNAALLDRAAARLPIPFLAAGAVRGPHGETVRLDHLHALGHLSGERLAAHLAKRPIFVSAASFEPFGLAVLEAAQTGCALILSDIPTFRELWDGAARFVPIEGDWCAAIEAVVRDPAGRAALGETARERAALYTPDATATRMLAVYREVLAAHPARPEGRRMRIVYFTHSLASCWNHGNAHFLRGVLSELTARGHDVRVFAPENAWSLANLVADHGPDGLDAYRAAYPELGSVCYPEDADPAAMVDGADLVLVHEWNDHRLVAGIGQLRKRGAPWTLLFHDTHHRAVSEPDQMRAYDLSGYDGVLAFGETLSAVYRGWGWGGRVWTWHEAADIRRFHPPVQEGPRDGLVWIGNWGDGERTEELERFLFEPARKAGLALDVHGVRYPEAARQTLTRYGAAYHGWAPNAAAPALFARHLATVHVPRRYYAKILPGIPTIRVFEALACGIPLVSAPWEDSEGLFRVGTDFLIVRSGEAMTQALRAVRDDAALRAALVASGLQTIRSRHTCAHRVDELLAIVARLKAPARKDAA